ncbi:MAG: ABC transporter permease [Phycisphaerae bacterium]|nr:ABC transporter permease [Gemmatimonadaceae bacterium]
MRIVARLVQKELLLLRRDWHALALLFIMPAFFILVMSLAMRDVFATGRTSTFGYYLVNEDTTAFAASIADGIGQHNVFRAVPVDSAPARRKAVLSGKVQFEVTIPLGFTRSLPDSVPLRINVVSGAGVAPPINELFNAAVREAVTRVYLRARVAALNPQLLNGVGDGDFLQMERVNAMLEQQTLYQSVQASRRPTSVQQNVPAWLVFAMFFVALPLSTTWLQERTQGTLTKLRSIGLAPGVLLAGKLIPYVVVNLAQVLLMLAVGVWVVPALGGDALTLGHSVTGLAVVAVATSAAAVAYGLLVANLVATTEQATIVTGATNLLLGALGGVMVPRSVMPEALQQISLVSPMSWGLEGFQDILLRDGDLPAVMPRVLALLAFALTALTLAGLRLRRMRTH